MEPEQVWSRVHMNLLDPVWGSKWLVIIDAKLKFQFVTDAGTDTFPKKPSQRI